MQLRYVMVMVAASSLLACGATTEPGSSIRPQSATEGIGGDDDPIPTTCSMYACGPHTSAMCDDAGATTILGVQRADGTPMRLYGEGDRLVGVLLGASAGRVEHAQLIGTRIAFRIDGGTQEARIDQVIAAASPLAEHYWVGAQSGIETYVFSFLEQTAAGRAREAVRVVAFGGDVYDPVTKRIAPGAPPTPPIFGCESRPLFKLHLLGHTTAGSSRLGLVIPSTKRQAMLNALTMNACGSGVTFDPDDAAITLRESQSLLPPSSPYLVPPVSFEAIWRDTGAVCLGTPRGTSGAASAARLREIALACGAAPPACSRAMLDDWAHHGDVLTGNPP
jgi:hypothetical protein